MLSDNQKARVTLALEETQQALMRAMRFSPDLRDNELISFYEKHIRHLIDYLNKGSKP